MLATLPRNTLIRGSYHQLDRRCSASHRTKACAAPPISHLLLRTRTRGGTSRWLLCLGVPYDCAIVARRVSRLVEVITIFLAQHGTRVRGGVLRPWRSRRPRLARSPRQLGRPRETSQDRPRTGTSKATHVAHAEAALNVAGPSAKCFVRVELPFAGCLRTSSHGECRHPVLREPPVAFGCTTVRRRSSTSQASPHRIALHTSLF